MTTPKYPSDLATRLRDLGEAGIHLNNKKGVCYVCGKDATSYSSSVGIDTRCKACAKRLGDNDLIYSPDTVWVKKVLSDRDIRERYNGVVKIDGKLYEITTTLGDTYDIHDLETGEEVKSLGLHISSRLMEQWYLAQGDATVYAHVVQLSWYTSKDEVAREMHYHVNWAGDLPIYDLGHSGRGWEKDVPFYMRLYVRLQPGMVNRDDFDLLDIQMVEEADASFLEGYEVAASPSTVINLRWRQAGPIFLRVLSGIKMDREFDEANDPMSLVSWMKEANPDFQPQTTMQRSIDRVREHYTALSRRYVMPTDAWITLVVARNKYLESHGEQIAHVLEHLIIHPNK